MFKYILTIIALVVSLVATNVSAGTSVAIDGIVQSSTSIVQDVIREAPEKSCYIKTVPVYGQITGTAADAIASAIIGGVIGNQVSKGKGKDAATIFGAIIGAKAAENGKKEIVGYREIEECVIKYTRKLVPMVVGYATTVKIILGIGFDDFVATFETTTQYIVGKTVPVRMTLSLD
jgi:uncharacterized protein YcfJ